MICDSPGYTLCKVLYEMLSLLRKAFFEFDFIWKDFLVDWKKSNVHTSDLYGKEYSQRNGEHFVADDDDSYSPHENALHTQHHRKAKENKRIFSLSLLIPQQLLCMLCVPIQLFFTKTWCLGRIIPPLLQSTVVFWLRKTLLNITSKLFSC